MRNNSFIENHVQMNVSAYKIHIFSNMIHGQPLMAVTNINHSLPFYLWLVDCTIPEQMIEFDAQEINQKYKIKKNICSNSDIGVTNLFIQIKNRMNSIDQFIEILSQYWKFFFFLIEIGSIPKRDLNESYAFR